MKTIERLNILMDACKEIKLSKNSTNNNELRITTNDGNVHTFANDRPSRMISDAYAVVRHLLVNQGTDVL